MRGRNILTIPERFHIARRTVRYTFYALFGVVVADGVITEFVVTAGHGLEANPLLRAWVGQDWFLVVKVGGAFLATLLLWLKYKARPRPVYAVAVAFLAFYTVVVLWNLSVFFVAAP